MFIKALFVLLVVSTLVVIGVAIAAYVRIRNHMAKPQQTQVLRKYPESQP